MAGGFFTNWAMRKALSALDFTSITSHIHNWVLFLHWLHPFILPGIISPLLSSGHLPTWGVQLSVSYLFAFSYCSWGSQGKNIEVVCHSFLQWNMFCQNSPPWPVHLGWPYTAWLIVSLSRIRLWSMWSVWLVFCDCGVHSVHPLMDKDKRLMEASWWERLTVGKLDLVQMGRAMLSKSLIQFSADGWGCVPSLLFYLRPTYAGDNEDDDNLLQKVSCRHCHTQCPWPCSRPPPTHTSTGDSWTLTGKSCGVTAPIYCYGQESLRRNGVVHIVNKRV